MNAHGENFKVIESIKAIDEHTKQTHYDVMILDPPKLAKRKSENSKTIHTGNIQLRANF